MHTADRVHELVRDNIHQSPLYNGQISGVGPRYCPSLEDKVMRFPDRERHQLFLEPEGLDVEEIYVNGFSMSLPAELQLDLVRSLPGLEAAEMLRPGYAVEYDFVQPTELSLVARDAAGGRAVPGRADQRHVRLRRGGRRRACWPASTQRSAVKGKDPLMPGPRRGVPRHPGRRPGDEGLSRALPDVHVEGGISTTAAHRQRRPAPHPQGPPRWEWWTTSGGRGLRGGASAIEENLQTLRSSLVRVDGGARAPAAQALRRPELRLSDLVSSGEVVVDTTREDHMLDITSVETTVKYEGYLQRQSQAVARAQSSERRRIPVEFPFDRVPGLSREMIQRFSEVRPETLGQAQRIPGVTPAAVAVVGAYIDRFSSLKPRA